jgi:DNA-binding transcriptional LysR family regulator
MPANSVSRHIQQLEADVGSRLIHRSTRKLTLTAAGRTFKCRLAPLTVRSPPETRTARTPGYNH